MKIKTPKDYHPSKALKALRKKAVRILEVKKRKANHARKQEKPK